MNLANSPTEDHLRALLRTRDDNTKGGHKVYVLPSGEVVLGDWPDAALEKRSRFHLEGFQQGNGYVGIAAAADDAWVSHLFYWLTTNWASGSTGFSDGPGT